MSNLSDLFGARSAGAYVAAGVLLAALGGCASVAPEPRGAAHMLEQNTQDAERLRHDVPALVGVLSLEEAQARALKFNLERRVRQLEEAMALRQYDASRFDVLPTLMAQAGYSARDSDRITQSRNIQTGELIPGNSITQERSGWTADLALNWNLLDLGLGVYNSRQQAARVGVAAERRRKATHLLLQDVRTAYWRALSAQKLSGQVKEAIAVGERALVDARQAEQEKLRNPLDSLRYRRQLLENLRLLESISQELAAAQLELASLLNLPPGTPLVLQDQPMSSTDTTVLSVPLERLEAEALYRNADLREAHFNSYIARDEVRKALMRMFPNISFNAAFKYDTDEYQVNQHWADNGLRISWNLFNTITAPLQSKAAQAGVQLADQRRLAAHAAVLTQVHLARQSVVNARDQLARAEDIAQTDRQIAERIRARVQMQAMGLLDRVSNDTAAILSELRWLQAAAQLRAAEGRMQATLGLEPDVPSTDGLPLERLIEQLKTEQSPWNVLTQSVAYPKPVRARLGVVVPQADGGLKLDRMMGFPCRTPC
jgi:outer membrane protein TolC